MAAFPSWYSRVIAVIDRFTGWTGYVCTVLIAPLILANTYEVAMRYVFNSPTSWALETTMMSFGTLFMLGSAYALLRGAHVRTDILWDKFSERKKGIIDSVAYVMFFLPTMAILFYISIDDFLYAWSIDERSNAGLWQPVIWPFRGVIPLTALLLFLQGVSELMKSLWAVGTGMAFVQREKIEI